ncbi:MAG: hypothetical protein N2450_02070 [bacterium]|nr:hypothetical protein [bacterium]
MVTGWHWVGRILGGIYLIYTIVYIFQNAIPNLTALSPFDWLAAIGLTLLIGGIIIGWIKDLLGGWLNVAGWIVYFTMYVMYDVTFWNDYFVLPSIIPGICFLMGYWAKTKNEEIE